MGDETVSHPGIRLRIRIPAGAIFDANSDFLYLKAKYTAIIEPDEWNEILKTVDGMVIECQAVDLPDIDFDLDPDTQNGCNSPGGCGRDDCVIC